jgi:hypothetical protein
MRLPIHKKESQYLLQKPMPIALVEIADIITESARAELRDDA